MDNYDDFITGIKSCMNDFMKVQNQIFSQNKRLVSSIIDNYIRDCNYIEHTFDSLLDLAYILVKMLDLHIISY